jgi:poly(hydroxyalkanoate) granule-associated protein
MAAKKKGKLGGSGSPRGEQNLLYSAHQIWLAGLGALSRAQAGAPKIFDELMREGSKLQGGALDAAQKVVIQAFQGAQKSVNQRVDTVKEQASETWDNLEKIFQTRVQRAMHQLGMPTAEEITVLTRKVDALAASVERLAHAAASRPGPKRRGARTAHARPHAG